MWLLLRKDVREHLGRFLVISLGSVLMFLSLFVAGSTFLTQRQIIAFTEEKFGDAYIVGHLGAPNARRFMSAGGIDLPTEQALLSAPGVDASRSYGLMLLKAALPTGDGITIFATDDNGLKQVGSVDSVELQSTTRPQLWVSPRVAGRLAAQSGDELELWNQRWIVRLLPSTPAFDQVALTRRDDAARLGVEKLASAIVLHGQPDLVMLRERTAGLDLFAPGTRRPELFPVEQELRAFDWVSTLIIILPFGAAMWVTVALPAWEQQARAGVLRALGASTGHRVLPLLGVLFLSVGLSWGITLPFQSFVSLVRPSSVLIESITLAKPMLIALPILLVFAFVVALPLLRNLLAQPCVPRQTPPRGPGTPVVIILTMLVLFPLAHATSVLTWVVSANEEDDWVGNRVSVVGRPGDISTFLDDATADQLLQLPSVDRAQSWRQISTWEPIKDFDLNLRGVDPNSLAQVIGRSKLHLPEGRLLGADEVVLGHRAAGILRAHIGDRVTIAGRSWRVVDILEPSLIHLNECLLPLEPFANAIGRNPAPNELVLALRTGVTARDFAADVARVWGTSPPIQFTSLGFSADFTWFTPNMLRFLIYSGFALVSIFLFISLVYSARAESYHRELAVLRAVGASRLRAARSMMREGIRLAVISGGIAVVEGLSIQLIFTSNSITWIDSAGFAIGVLLSLIPAAVGALVPMLRLLRLPTAQLLRLD